MVNIDALLKHVSSKLKDRTVTEIYDYDEKVYLVVAPDSEAYSKGLSDYGIPFFVVVKENGLISPYNPLTNIERFEKVTSSTPLYSRRRR